MQGCDLVITLFDSSELCSNLFGFFFQWIIEDPRVAVLIKPKCKDFLEMIEAHDIYPLYKQAIQTNRVVLLDHKISPSVPALSSDFSVGVGSPSAIIVSSLVGAKVIYFDPQHADHPDSILSRFALLYTLGKNRCVFYSLDDIRNILCKYLDNPSCYTMLGDISPLHNKIDPFRDGMAGDRISDFISWYLEGIDKGYDRFKSLELAARRYSDQWGSDKVFRNI